MSSPQKAAEDPRKTESDEKDIKDLQPYDRRDEGYFSYYAMLAHQAQMLQDAVRTSAYQMAIMTHSMDHFQDKTVMDVGAGNGILSLFSLQMGAKHVYAVEASGVVEGLRKLVRAAGQGGANAPNAWVQNRLSVVHARMEDVSDDMLRQSAKEAGADPKQLDNPPRVDTIVSECLGVVCDGLYRMDVLTGQLLVHERMCETFLEARDRFLRPGGAIFPRTGTMCFSLLHDPRLWQEVSARGDWWNTQNFYGIDLTPLVGMARTEAFASPVVGSFPPTSVIGSSMVPGSSPVAYTCADGAVCHHLVDFSSISLAELRDFTVPVSWDCVEHATIMHGLAAWFDLSFAQPGDQAADGTEGASNEGVADADEATQAAFSAQAPPFAPTNTTQASWNTMTTSPFAPTTHWAQVRLVLAEPLALNRGQRVAGTLHFRANENRSYDIDARLRVPLDGDTGKEVVLQERAAVWKLDKQTYSWDVTPVN